VSKSTLLLQQAVVYSGPLRDVIESHDAFGIKMRKVDSILQTNLLQIKNDDKTSFALRLVLVKRAVFFGQEIKYCRV